MKTLHLDLKPVADNYVELRYFWDNPNQYEKRSLPLAEIADLIQLAEQDYYVRLAVEYTITGRKLYNWLDGSDRLLSRTMQQHSGESLILAIAAGESLAHLPWEVLHDGNNFLVARVPAVVPVRWVSDEGARHVLPRQPPEQPPNRALQVLFMATSPLGVKPVLEFEAEEGRILQATARQPLALVVEESGSLTELGYLIDDYDKGFFDVLHLTGHATITENGEPRFYTETETGECYLASAVDIAKSLKSRLPQLIFLSGCRTGQGGQLGAVPSLAEGLLKLGAKAVLGWGQTVLDTDATAAAAVLYGELAAGYEVTEALSRTYQALIKQQARDWHLLRLYVARTLPGNLVTTLRTRGRKPAPKPSVAEQFLDVDTKQVKVASRGSFVGRRRQLQNCLRALKNPPSPPYQGGNTGKTPPDQGGNIGGVGVLIHGMGGLGKSTLAARLCDRLPEFERIVWVGRVDEGSLVKRLTEKLPKELRQVLQSDDDELKFRLRDVFAQLEEEAAQPFLLVLDDFEHNLEPRNDGYVLQPEAAMVLEALLWAIEETYARHRVILTCRYDFESGWLQKFYKQPLEGLRGADLEKKCNRLSAFGVNSQVDEALQSQALRLADGNPRLLEWLDKVLLNLDPPQPPFFRGEKNTVAEILARLETNPVELRQKVLAQALLAQIDQPLEEILRRGLVFELPVPRDALATVCEEIPSLDTQINRAVALGLLEVTPDESLRVPRILEKNLTLQPPSLPGKGEKEPGKGENVSSFTPAEDAQQAGNRENNSSFSPLLVGEGLGERLYQQAAEVLYRLWWEEAETSTEEQRLEIHRLALGGKAEEIAVEMAVALTNHWINRSLYREVVKTCEETLEVVEDSGILYRLALCEQELGEVDKALGHYQQALDSCPSGDKAKKAAIIHNLAIIKANQGQTEEAITLYEQSLTLKEDIGDLQGKAATLQQLGIVKYNTGEIEEAIAIYQQSLVLTERIGDVNTKAAILHCLAIIKTHQGQIEEARELYMQSLALSESNGNVQGKAATLQCLGYLKAVQGQTEEAITFYEQSLALTEDIGHAQTKAITLHELGRLKENSGEIEEAIALYEQSLALTESTGNVQTKASTLQCLGYLKANSGEIEEAIALFQQSLALAESSSNFQTQAATLQCLGYLKANSGEIEEAIALYKQSLALSESNGYAQIKAATLHRLGQMLADEKEDFAAALNCLQQSLDIWQDIQSPKAEEVRQAIARVQQMRDDIR